VLFANVSVAYSQFCCGRKLIWEITGSRVATNWYVWGRAKWL